MADWKAETYHRVSEPQTKWGEAVLAALELRGDETVMDAGCGTGRLTAKLVERLPRGRVVALDASPAMLEVAKRELARFGDKVTFVRASLGEESLPSGMDVVFSTATFHWVKDHDALFRSLLPALVPGGRLRAQFGGGANLARTFAGFYEIATRPRYARYFESVPPLANFRNIEETRKRLEAAGFVDLHLSYRDEPTTFADAAAYAEFAGAVVLRRFLEHVPPELHASFVAEATERAEVDDPPLTLDYVRLDVFARRPA
jgi:trans-aconitate methyltransferase